MKKKILSVFLVFAFAVAGVAFAGCGTQNQAEGLVIYTSMYPIYDLTQKVVGNNAQIINLVGPGEESHHYELTPQQRVALESADLIVINGLDIEHWTEDLPASIMQKVLVASDGIQVLQTQTSGGILRDDPHAWLSLRNAVIMMENIKNKMAELDNANAATYQRNYDRKKVLFESLDASYVSAVNNFVSTTIVVSHKAFGYIARDYGLTQLAISGLESDDEADPQTVADIIDFINSNNINVVFYQESMSAQIANAIAAETSARTEMLYTIEGLSAQQNKDGEDFLSLLAHNLTVLIAALSE